MKNSIQVAEDFATIAHKGQMYGNVPYIEHLLAVANTARLMLNPFNLSEIEINIVAFLHDIVEDTSVLLDDLKELFSEEVVEAVACLTKIEGQSYEDYIDIVKSNKLALHVKIADTMCNLRASIYSQDKKRITKYAEQYYILTKEYHA